MPPNWLLYIPLLMVASGTCIAGERIKRLKNNARESPGHGVLLFSQVKTHKRDLLWGFEVGRPDQRSRYLAGRELRLPNGFYDIGCGRLGSMTAISLQPGTYELGPWKINASTILMGPFSVSGGAYKGPETRFTIEIRQGEITYAGEISIDELRGNAATILDNLDCEMEYVGRTWPWMRTLPATDRRGFWTPTTPWILKGELDTHEVGIR